MVGPFTHLATAGVLARYRDFRNLFVGNSISLLGSSVTMVALPLTAVVYLDASPAEMGVLGAVALLPHLVLGLRRGVGGPHPVSAHPDPG